MAVLRPSSTAKPRQSKQRSILKSKIGEVVLIICSFLLYLFLIPVLLVLLIPLYLYRLLVVILAKFFRRDFVEIVCCRDGVVGLDDVTQKSQCMLLIPLVLRGTPDLEYIRSTFQSSVMDAKNSKGRFAYRKLKYFYESWLGYCFWKEDDQFKLNEHVRFCEESEASGFDENGKKVPTTQTELLKILGPLDTRPFGPGKSPWEFLVVRNYVADKAKVFTNYVPTTTTFDLSSNNNEDDVEQFVLLIRIHHAIADGFSILKLILNRLGGVPKDALPAPLKRDHSAWHMFKMYTGVIVLSPYYNLKQLVIEIDRNLWHLQEKELKRDWHLGMTEKVPLETLKGVARTQGVSVTAVLLAAAGGAFRRFLKEIGEEKNIPEVIRALSPMPMSNHPMDDLVNRWTLGVVTFPTGYECPKKRMQVAESSVQLLKTSPILLTNYATVPMLLSPPKWFTDVCATNWFTTAITSNFPGPESMHDFMKKYPALDFWHFMPQMRGSASLGVTFLSYNGGVRTALTIDKAIIPRFDSAQRLSQCFTEEYDRLRNLPPASTQTVV